MADEENGQAGAGAEGAVGWIGTGRMGLALVERLLSSGTQVEVWNRTRAKAEPLTDLGAHLVEAPVDLAGQRIVFTMVASSDAFIEVMLGEGGLLTGDVAPGVVVDCSTISVDAAEAVAAEAAKLGTELLAAPVSGNAKVVASGKLGVVVSGDRAAYELSAPYLRIFGSTVTYVGEENLARVVKICHNLVLGIVTQALVETTVLAERAGVSRADYLDFINGSVMGSVFSRYKTPALVGLDWTPTFTGHLLRKDFELGLEAARHHDVPVPLSATVHQLLMHLVGSGRGDVDFASLLELEAQGAGLDLRPEPATMDDGLGAEAAATA